MTSILKQKHYQRSYSHIKQYIHYSLRNNNCLKTQTNTHKRKKKHLKKKKKKIKKKKINAKDDT